MHIGQFKWNEANGWDQEMTASDDVDLVLAFGDRKILEYSHHYAQLKHFYPQAQIVMCSTAGEILAEEVFDHCLTVTTITFERSRVQATSVQIDRITGDEFELGAALGHQLEKNDLQHLMVFSHGLNINGTKLIKGIRNSIDQDIVITGGLSGDGPHFEKTLVGLNAQPTEGMIVGVGFYGEHLKVGYGSVGGWDTFGHERTITRSEGNVLYELDGKPALELYKQYLGEKADELPASGLLFPLSIKSDRNEEELVRTILGVNEAAQSLTFAGDVPEGVKARLMKANFERLYDGAAEAAENSIKTLKHTADLAILISCVGRKLLLKQRIEDEIESVREIVGPKPYFTGFYSYGEIGPGRSGEACYLHNQTMTITLIAET
jgi:hypothetical protein